MNTIVRLFLGDKSAQEVLVEDAAAIKEIGDDDRVYTFDTREEDGFVTARSRPVPVGLVKDRVRK